MTSQSIKNKVGSFLNNPHFPFFLLPPIKRISPTLERFLRYGRYNPNTERYWNKRYASGEYQESEAERYGEIHRVVAQLVPPLSRVLDVGCGTGRLMEILRDQKSSCVGVDISSVAVEMVRRKGFSAFQSKLPKLPPDLETNSFDVCTIVETLEHISEPSLTLRNISQLLKAGSASLIVCVPNDCMKPNEFDEHVSQFNDYSLREMMSRYYHICQSFSIESVGYRYLIMTGKKSSLFAQSQREL
jgi:2-polyprenyl-3-methyl-5-hydroxy-6-metoxy-1,4-benzoquinol methylase